METTTSTSTTPTTTTNLHQTKATDPNKTSARIKLNASSSGAANSRKQLSSFVLFLSVIILVNLCPFQSDFEPSSGHQDEQQQQPVARMATFEQNNRPKLASENLTFSRQYSHLLTHMEACLEFVKLMFKNPMKLGKRTTRFTLAEARVLGKMAKVWYIKKKIKKLSKKLKKHTIAVPVFTAIPIYEHSYYPQPHVTHVTHGGGMHHAASSYSPALAQVATGSASPAPGQQMAASASNNHQIATYRMAPGHNVPQHQPHHPGMYHQGHPGQMHSAGQIINAYAPSPALYVDDAGGLYGTYGNAYGRYDGGYHYW